MSANFWSKVDQSAGEDECWPWLKAKMAAGYGECWFGQRVDYSHRVAYRLAKGPIPSGLFVCHTCDNRCCCNPRHLFIGTQKENQQDSRRKKRGYEPPRFYGEMNRNQYLPIKDETVKAIRKEYVKGDATQNQLAVRYGVSQSSVSDYVKRTNRARGTFVTPGRYQGE